MTERLIIVESPTKAKTLKKFLGRRFKIVASKGHLIDLPKSKMGIDIENNFQPKYITIRGKGKILSDLKQKAKKADQVLLATDPDREGEAISYHLANALQISDKNCRVTFNEITKEAVKTALKQPQKIDMKLVNAQQGRRILDRLVGYKLSPLLWEKVKKGLSAGRVQTVALRLICEREREIEAFKPEEYWSFHGEFKVKAGSFAAELFRINNQKVKCDNKKDALNLQQEIEKQKYFIDSLKEGERRRNPFPPFITSTLQQEAIKQLGFTARKTMTIAQRLYEGVDLGKRGSTGLITYMRTDSLRIASDAQNSARDYISSEFGPEYLPANPRQYKQKGRTQDAHEAIRPTNPKLSPQEIKEFLDQDQFKLYQLIWQRFMGSQMKQARFKTITCTIKGGKFLFRATGSKLIFKGFLAIYNKLKSEDKLLCDIEADEAAELKKLKPEQHFTQPAPRYTEGSLVKVLEEKGIGRPSTYAPIVATIVQRGYVMINEKRFYPTELGFVVNDLLINNFPLVTDVKFTAEMEAKLDLVEEGKQDWLDIIAGFYDDFSQRVEQAREKLKTIKIADKETDIPCAKCGAKMVEKFGRFGKFLACPNFPECRYTQPYLRKEDIDCFKCETGKIVERKSKKGRVFYGCNNYPNCDYTTYKRPLTKKCPLCGAFMQKENNNKSDGGYVCARTECDYKSTEI